MFFAVPFFLFVAVMLPLAGWAAIRQARNLPADEAPTLDHRAVAFQLGILQTVLAALALLALHGTALDLAWWSGMNAANVLASVATLAAFLVLSVLEARRPLGPEARYRAELRKVSVRNPVWTAVTVYAGIVEEFAYRGVLTTALAAYLGYLPATAVSAALFGLGHLSGGWRGAAMAVLFALAMQWLTHLSGGLALAVAVHVAYDMLAALLGQRLRPR